MKIKDTIVYVKPIPAICQKCVEESHHMSDAVAMVWCPHFMSGGIYIVEAGLWQLAGPFEAESDYKRYISNLFTPRAAAKH